MSIKFPTMLAGHMEIGGFMLPVAKIDRKGPLFKREVVTDMVRRSIQTESHFYKKAKIMTTDADKATSLADDVTARFSTSISALEAVEQRFITQSKKMSGEVRDASEKLAQGLQRIEKAANFDRLEKYVDLLERASVAMTSLAKLESEGRLEKIASAIR